MKRRKWIWTTVIVVIVLLVLAWALIPPIALLAMTSGHVDYTGMISTTYPLQGIYTAEDFGLDATEMYLETEDGYTIWASEVYVEQPRAVIIYLTGIMQPSVTYFYGHSAWMAKEGYATILLEVRGHGNSEGNRIGLGYEETADVRAVVNYIKSQTKYKEVPVVIQGVSMGGSIAINAFGQIPEIDGLIAMSAYSSVEDVALEGMRQYGIPQFICQAELPIIELSLQLVYGENVKVDIPFLQVQNIGNRPAFFIAAEGDMEVFVANTERLLAAAPDHCERWIRPTADHFIVLGSDLVNVEQDTEYCAQILRFLEKNFA